MKKCCLNFILLILIILLTTGCSSSDSDYVTPDKQAKNQSEQVMVCVLNKDIEGLKAMFCKNIQGTHDLDKEIQEALDFIDGNIISHDTPEGSIQSKSMSGEEGIVEMAFSGGIKSIKTDTGKTYIIGFNSYSVYKEDEDNIGVTLIGITDVDFYTAENDYPDSAKREIGEVIK